jgi:hypothetical protein
MKRASPNRLAVAALVGCAVIASSLMAPEPRSAQGAAWFQPTPARGLTPTPTPTRRAGAVARLLLRGVNTRSPDGAGSGIKAEVILPVDGPWQGPAFEFRRLEGPSLSVEFVIFKIDPATGERVEVYRHVERNPPWCPLSDMNGQCNAMPFVNNQFRWPDSDDAPGSGVPVVSGQYVMEVIATGDRDQGGGSWRKRVAEDNAIYFSLEQTFEVPLPRLTGRAAIVAPRSGTTFGSVVDIRGTATSNNFAYYKFELLDSRCANGVCFLMDFRRPVVNGLLWRWDTLAPLPNGVVLPNGTWTMQLVVVDKWERALPNPPAITFTLQN